MRYRTHLEGKNESAKLQVLHSCSELEKILQPVFELYFNILLPLS